MIKIIYQFFSCQFIEDINKDTDSTLCYINNYNLL